MNATGSRARAASLGVAVAAAALGLALWAGRPGGDPSLLPVTVPVTLAAGAQGGDRTLWVQRDEVTVAAWNLCHGGGGCAFAIPARRGMDPAATPATGISHADAQGYADWLGARGGHPFRLPDLAEWQQMAARVLPQTPAPIFDAPELSWASAYILVEGSARALRPSGAFSTSPEGVRDLDGNVWEWTRDCAAGDAGDRDHCPAYHLAGEHVAVVPWLERDPARGGCAVGSPPAHLGLRLVSDREPPSRDRDRNRAP